MPKIKRKRKHMKQNEFFKELKNRGFTCEADWDLLRWTKENCKNIELITFGGFIEEWEGYPIPYTLKLNGKRVIGNQRCLKYIDELLNNNE